MTDTVTLGNVDFVVQDDGSSGDRAAVIKTLQTFAEMEKVQKDFTTPFGANTNTVTVVVGEVPNPAYKGGYTEVTRNGFGVVTNVTIYIDPVAIDVMRKKGADGDYYENTIPATLANELGDVGVSLNPDFPTGETDSSGNPNPMYGNDPYDSAHKDMTDRASIRYENEVGRLPYGLPPRDVNSENNTKDDGKILTDPGNIPVAPSDSDHTKAAAAANQGNANPHAEATPDDSTGNSDDLDDWLRGLEDPFGLNPEMPDDEDIEDALDLFGVGESKASPIILDLDGDGIELSALSTNNTSFFDLDNDGFAERTGWVDSDDGILVLDDGDGRIQGTSEWFGTMDTDGFSIALQYDSNADGVLSEEDTIWTSLQIWRDFDQDGVSDAGELRGLDEYNILSINLNATEVSTTNAGHAVTHTSTYTYDTGSGTATRAANDIWFNYDDMSTRYAQDYTFDMRAAYVGTLRGYGVLPDLHIAMSLDNEDTGNLLGLVQSASEFTFDEIFEGTSFASDVLDILYRWAGVDDVSASSRGTHIDARKLEFLENLFGQSFLQAAHQPNPLYNASGELIDAFDLAFNHYYARLALQIAGKELFDGADQYYSLSGDSYEGITGLNAGKLDELEVQATGLANTGARQTFWENVVRMVEYSVGTANLSGGDLAALQAAITASDVTLDLEDDILPALGGNSDLYNGGNNQTINGTTGDDSLSGNAGNDLLNASNGNDTLNGGTGYDYLKGGNGNDTYVFADGDGEDVVEDTSGTDTISFGSGIDSGDLTLTRSGNDDLLIEIDNGTNSGVIFVSGQFESGKGIETILFNDTSTIDLTTRNWTLTGSSDNETLEGVNYGGGTVDTIYGMAGNDKLYGYAGNDTLYGGDGNDIVDGGNDNDTLYGDSGSDKLTGGTGNDHLYDGTGDDEVAGNGGDDTFHYGGGHDVYTESSGTDSIVLASGIASSSTIYYRFGSDLQIVFDASNTITIPGYYSAGGAKIETLDFYSDTDVNLTTVSTITQGDDSNNTLYGTTAGESIYGNGGNDTVHANNGNDFLYGGTGNDTLNGSYGNDWLEGGAGNDTMNGGNDNDTYLFTSGIDEVNELGGTDELRFISGWTASDLTFSRNFGTLNDLLITINGSNQVTIANQFYTSGYAVETIRFADNSTINLLTRDYITYGNSSNNSISGIVNNGGQNDTIYGYGGNDTLSGGDGNDTLYGGDGTDTLTGAAGNDYLDGGAGDDTLTSTGGDDTFFYSAGLDTVTESGGGTDNILMGSGIDVNAISFSTYSTNGLKITVTASTDELSLTNQRHGTSTYHIETIEFADGFKTSLPDYASWVNGTSGNDLIAYSTADDTIIAKAGNDTITAGGGNDDVHGGDGNDDISGQGGNDLLHGGAGNDILYGGDGLDTLFGGAGEDTFVFETASAFNNIDVIKDFDVANDSIDLSDILSGYDPMTDLLTDWVEMTNSGTDTILKVDRDGDGGTYSLAQIATIQGVTGLTDEAALVSGGQLLVA